MKRLRGQVSAVLAFCLLAGCAGNQVALKQGNTAVAKIYMNKNSPDCMKWTVCDELYQQLYIDGQPKGFELRDLESPWTGTTPLVGEPDISDPQLDLSQLADNTDKYVVVLYSYGDVITTRTGPTAHVIYIGQELSWKVVAKTFDAKTHRLIQTATYHRRFNGEGDDLRELAAEIGEDLFK